MALLLGTLSPKLSMQIVSELRGMTGVWSIYGVWVWRNAPGVLSVT